MHYDRGGKVREILFELLEDKGLISCVILGKWDGKEEYREVLAQDVDPENEEKLMKQMNKISQDGIKMVEGRVVKIICLSFVRLRFFDFKIRKQQEMVPIPLKLT